MTAANHALTGAIIGLLVGEPLVAVPAAIASHFICDALPHYAHNGDQKKLLRSEGFRNYLILEAGLCGLLVLVLFIGHPQHWLLAAFCAFLATAPDLLWINRYVKIRYGKKWKPNAFSRLAAKIQWFQRPVGAAVEAAWFAGALIILLPFLR